MMPLVILEGPEAAGKTTITDHLLEAWGSNSRQRRWGPRLSWLEYCGPLFDDTQACKADPQLLIVWSRSWLSRSVYNELLQQGQDVPPRAMTELDRVVLSSGGLLILVVSPARILAERRQVRLETGSDQQDHPLDPAVELKAFLSHSRKRKWQTLSGVHDPQTNVQSILSSLVSRNPECRMTLKKEDSSDEYVIDRFVVSPLDTGRFSL